MLVLLRKIEIAVLFYPKAKKNGQTSLPDRLGYTTTTFNLSKKIALMPIIYM